jgi:hypothetical protein
MVVYHKISCHDTFGIFFPGPVKYTSANFLKLHNRQSQMSKRQKELKKKIKMEKRLLSKGSENENFR